jgi:catechol 2,3-dioxygenase-like lactoylglutathione lyase family enzyme
VSTERGFPDHRAAVEPLLAVRDLERSLAFWRDLMGGAPVMTWDSCALLQLGAGRLHLAVTGEPPEDRAVRLVPPLGPAAEVTGEVVLRVDDCAGVVRELEQRGVRFLGPPATPAWGGEVRAFLQDPDGHLVEISSVD